MKESKYDIIVTVGRYEPIHKGHIPTFVKAANLASTVVCVIGSANRPRDPKNPFSAKEREVMITDALLEENPNLFSDNKVKFISVEDTFYLDNEWYRRVKTRVQELEKEVIKKKQEKYKSVIESLLETIEQNGITATERAFDVHLELHGTLNTISQLILSYRNAVKESNTCNIAVMGHMKDKSSEYLNNLNWPLIDIGAFVGDTEAEDDSPISATDIRDLWFCGKLSYARSNLMETTYNTLKNYPKSEFFDLQAEWNEIQKYRSENQVGPNVVQFLTADAVVIRGDEILMVRRGGPLGKGLWALPGGFKNYTETFFDSCVRELQEETKIKLSEHVIRLSQKEEKMFDYPDRSLRGTTVSMVYSFILDPSKPRPPVKGAYDAVQAWWFSYTDILAMRDQIFEDHLDMIEYMMARR